MKCTWVDCQSEATHPQLNKFDEEWANLCDEHNAKMKNAMIEGEDVKKLVSY